MKAFSTITSRSYDPIRIIEWVIAVCTAFGGTYIFTPLYEQSLIDNGASILTSALSYPTTIFVFGAVLLIGSALIMYGLWKDKPQVESLGLFMVLLARFFQILTVFIVAGFTPITWIYPLTVFFIILTLWINTRVKVRRLAIST